MRINHVRPSWPTILAAIALVVAGAGGGYAAAKIDTKQLANKAVTKAKLAPSERSAGFLSSSTAEVALPQHASTVVARLKLPKGGKYLVSATTTLGNSQSAVNLVNCQLLNEGDRVSGGSELLPALPVYGTTITLEGKAKGGNVRLLCNPSIDAFARDRVITATRVGTLRAG